MQDPRLAALLWNAVPGLPFAYEGDVRPEANALARFRFVVVLSGQIALSRAAEAQQAVGHILPGTLGLQAGTQARTGLYFVDRFAGYRADELIGRHGASLPVGLGLDVVSNVFGVAFTYEITPLRTYVGASVAVPVSKVSASTQIPEASTDLFGLGDLFVQPLALGWRSGSADIVAGYAFYAPTGGHEPGGNDGVGAGQWTHELSLGGTLYFDRAHTWALSALASVEFPRRKFDVDVTRGSILQIQGGLGKTIGRFFDVGLASYALWQLADDKGADLPTALRDQRDRAYGLGPEMGVAIPSIRTRVTVRYEHDFAVRSRPEGQILVLEMAVAAWDPRPGE